MRKVFFNSFKETILRGEVPDHFELSGIPVNSDFIDLFDNNDIALEQFRTLDDLSSFNRNRINYKFNYEELAVDYSAYYPDDLSEKPLFVNSENSAKFLAVYGHEIKYGEPGFEYITNKFNCYLGNDNININSGFYYVLKESELNWIAKRCNDDYNFNNRIIVVLGDDLGNQNDYTQFKSVICPDPERPFQGIFDFNAHKITHKVFQCNGNSTGLIGYLGTDGIVRDGIIEDIKFLCNNKITLTKIQGDCSDVVVGGVVGTNYGAVLNMVTSGSMQFEGFCPEVYLVSNKSEYEIAMDTNSDTAVNAFFPNKFCINSLDNTAP